MPGWHVERVGQGPVSSIPNIVVAKRERKRTELRESIVSLPELRSAHTALRSKKPRLLPIVSTHDVKFLRTRQEAQPIAKQIPTQTSGHIKERVGLNASAPGVFGAFLLYGLAYCSGTMGIILLIVGAGVGLFDILLLGFALLVLAGYLIKWARLGSESRMQAARQLRNKAKQRLVQAAEKSAEAAQKAEQEAEQEAAEKEAERAAEREQLRLQREQKMRELEEIRRQRAEEKRARKARRQAFYQDPFVKIALGFGAIIGLYFLLF